MTTAAASGTTEGAVDRPSISDLARPRRTATAKHVNSKGVMTPDEMAARVREIERGTAWKVESRTHAGTFHTVRRVPVAWSAEAGDVPSDIRCNCRATGDCWHLAAVTRWIELDSIAWEREAWEIAQGVVVDPIDDDPFADLPIQPRKRIAVGGAPVVAPDDDDPWGGHPGPWAGPESYVSGAGGDHDGPDEEDSLHEVFLRQQHERKDAAASPIRIAWSLAAFQPPAGFYKAFSDFCDDFGRVA